MSSRVFEYSSEINCLSGLRLVVICSRSVEVEFILMGRRKSGAQKRKNSSEGTNCQSKSARNGGSSENSLFVCCVALRPKSTAMVIAGRSVHLTTLFPGQA